MPGRSGGVSARRASYVATVTGTHQETTRALVRDANVMSVAYVLDGFPELSETFVLNEIRALTALGSRVTIVARRRPSDAGPVHREAERFIDGCLYCPAGSFIRFSRVLEALLLRGHRSWWALALCLRLFFCSPRGGAASWVRSPMPVR